MPRANPIRTCLDVYRMDPFDTLPIKSAPYVDELARWHFHRPPVILNGRETFLGCRSSTKTGCAPTGPPLSGMRVFLYSLISHCVVKKAMITGHSDTV